MTDLTRRAFGLAVSTAALAAPMGSVYAAGATRPVDAMEMVDPELRGFLKAMAGHGLAFNAQSLPMVRKIMGGARPPRPDVPVSEQSIPGPAGAPPVKILVVGAGQTERRRPAILYVHGGGFVAGSAAADLPRAQALAADHSCVVVSVDYRLSPETPFPGPREDVYAALKWLHANADILGVDVNRIVLFGPSAGGGLVAQTAIVARDRGEVPVRAQILLYPMLDDRGPGSPPPPFIGAFVWTRKDNQFAWSSYLGHGAGSASAVQRASPAREPNLQGLPPTWIGVGALDLLADEDLKFAQRLMLAGVPTEVLVTPGAYHAFNDMASSAAVSKSFNASWGGALARALGS